MLLRDLYLGCGNVCLAVMPGAISLQEATVLYGRPSEISVRLLRIELTASRVATARCVVCTAAFAHCAQNMVFWLSSERSCAPHEVEVQHAANERASAAALQVASSRHIGS
jgi:hypothetical protein